MLRKPTTALAAVTVAVLATVGPIGGVSAAGESDWPMFGRDRHHTGNVPGETKISRQTATLLAPKWTVQVSRPVTASPTVVGGIVYVGGWDGVFRALRASDGSALWTFQTDPHTGNYPGIIGSAAVDHGKVYIAAGPNVYALDAATGTIVWKFVVGGGGSTDKIETTSSPVVYNGRVYIGTDADEEVGVKNLGFYALDAATGQLIWRFNEGPCVSVWSTAVIDELSNQVFIATGDCGEWKDTDGALYPNSHAVIALAADTGHMVWKYQPRTVDPGNFDFGQPPNLFTATIAGHTRHLVGAGSKEGIYYALDRATGELVWKTQLGDPAFKLPVPGSPAVGSIGGLIGGFSFDGHRLYGATATLTPSTHFFAVDPATGQILWKDDTAPASFAGTTTANGVALVGGLDQVIRVYNTDTGQVIAALPAGRVVASQAAVVNGEVFVGNGVGGGKKGGGAEEPGGAILAYALPPAP